MDSSNNIVDIKAGERHATIKRIHANFPSDMLRLPQWVCWRSIRNPVSMKPAKVPIDPNAGDNAKVNDKMTWATFDKAARRYIADDGYAGVGFVFTEDDPYAGIDLDKCRDPETGEVGEWAKNIITHAGTYAEISPSKTGVKAYGLGKLPGHKGFHPADGRIELYSAGRWFAVTGEQVEDTPSEARNIQPFIDAILATHKAKSNGAGEYERFDTARALEGVPEGERDDTAWKLACKLRNADVPEDWAETLVLEAAANCDPPFEADKALDKVHRAYRTYPAGNSLANGPEPSTNGHGDSSGDSGRGPTQTDTLIRLVDEGATLWHTPDRTAYASVTVGDHIENHKVESKAFTDWMVGSYYRETGKAPGSNARTDARLVVSAKAVHDSPEHRVWMRSARGDDGAIYIDLGTPDWTAVKVTGDGWDIVVNPPVKFVRGRHKGALPVPSDPSMNGGVGGDVEPLRSFINISSDEDFELVLAWLVQALKPEGPYPVLDIEGEQGSAKSSTAKILYSLVDPSTESEPLRTQPKNEHDLAVAARNNWCLAYDNLSWIAEWLSDALCRLATGGAFGTRTLYEDEEETLLSAKRPIIVNSIVGVINRPDLQDRALVVKAPYIQENMRRTEESMKTAFTEAAPVIFAGILDGISASMRAPVSPQMGGSRLIDFMRWATPALEYFGYPGLEDDYKEMRADTNAVAIQADAVAVALILFMRERNEWSGSATTLLKRLEGIYDPLLQYDRKRWPQGVSAFSRWLNRSAPTLRAVGLEVSEERSNDLSRQRTKVVRWHPHVDRATVVELIQDKEKERYY